jgi:hypothetical protein
MRRFLEAAPGRAGKPEGASAVNASRLARTSIMGTIAIGGALSDLDRL